jgi:sulfate/thiosulfate transport system ATP-binding protein
VTAFPDHAADDAERAARLERRGRLDIRIAGISKRFNGQAALDGVDLEIGHGELIALLGPSGSGKTTLLRIIAGLERQDEGLVALGGHDASHVRVQDRGVGFVFQHYALFRHMTIFDNIAYGLTIRPRATRPSRADIARRVSELLDLVQLQGLDARYPRQLSGGQRQRVALARALAIEPRVLLLDEPFGALDAKVRKELRRWLRDIHHRTGQTTVFVTHDQDEALELADRVAILNRGRIEQVGTPDDIYDHPASAFVAGFVGESALVPVCVVAGEVRLGDCVLNLPRGSVSTLQDGPARLFVRPAETQMVPVGPGTLPGRVLGIRRTATGRRAEIAIEGSGAIVEVDGVPQAAVVGSLVGLTLDRARIFPA